MCTRAITGVKPVKPVRPKSAKNPKYPSSQYGVPDSWTTLLADRKPLGAATEFHCHHCFVLQTSSPNPENYEKLKKQYVGTQYVLPAWSWEEIVAAR
jgi:hypothetical protein